MSLKVLLICGSGASSGFMAASMRKEVKQQGLDYKIQARSEAELENYLNNIDVLMIGPHLAYIEDEIIGMVDASKVKVILMKPDYYSLLDGKGAIKHLQHVLDAK